MRQTRLTCDFPGCTESTPETGKAGAFEGWLTRRVTDGYTRVMAEGARELTGHQTFHFCPGHAEKPEALPSPGLHPEVLAFKYQPDTGDGSGA